MLANANTTMPSTLEALTPPVSRASSSSSVPYEKLRLLSEFLDSLALRRKVDFEQYKNVIQELFVTLKQIGTIGELFEAYKNELHLPVTRNDNVIHIRQAIMDSTTLGFIFKTSQSTAKAGCEEEILNSLIVWYYYTQLRFQYDLLFKGQMTDTSVFIDIGYQLAVLLQPNSPLCEGLLREINIIEPMVDVGLAFHVTPISTPFINMLSAVTLSHISRPLLHEGFLRRVDLKQSFRFYHRWTNLFMAYCPPNHFAQVLEEPSIPELLNKARMLPLISDSWSLELHFNCVFAGVQISDYIPVITEMLVRSKPVLETMKKVQSSLSQDGLQQILANILKSCQNPLNQDIYVINLSSCDALMELSKLSVSTNPAIAEDCKTLYSIIVDKYVRNYGGMPASRAFTSYMMENVIPNNDVDLYKLDEKHFRILFELIDGSKRMLRNAEFASLFCLSVKVLEISTQSSESVEEVNWILSSMKCRMTVMALVSHLIFHLGRYLMQDVGQEPCISLLDDLFIRPLPAASAGKHGDLMSNEKIATVQQRINIKEELYGCMLPLVIALYRNVLFCASIFRDSGNTDLKLELVRNNELKTITGALVVALDVATAQYPHKAGNAMLENVALQTFGVIAKEYQKQGVSLVVNLAGEMAVESLRFGPQVAKIVAKVLTEVDLEVSRSCSDIIGATLGKILGTWGSMETPEMATLWDLSMKLGFANTVKAVKGKVTKLDLSEYSEYINAPKRVKGDKK